MIRTNGNRLSEEIMRLQGTRERKPWLKRFGWLALIWTASVAALAVVALVIRVLMSFAGLTAG